MTDFDRAMYEYDRKNYPWYAEESAYLNGHFDDDPENEDEDENDEQIY